MLRLCVKVTNYSVWQSHIVPIVWSTSQHLCGRAPVAAKRNPRAVIDHIGVGAAASRTSGVIEEPILSTITGRVPHATIVMLEYHAAGNARSPDALARAF